MPELSFTVPGLPIAQPRQRHRLRTSPVRQYIENYTPKAAPVNAFKAAVIASAQVAHTGGIIDAPIKLWATFILPRPQYLVWKTKPMNRRWCSRKPDLDNLVKSLKDAITQAGIWRDDSLVVWENTQKLIAAGDESPHVYVRIQWE